MPFQSIKEVSEALAGSHRLPNRTLHEIWRQREPVLEEGRKEKAFDQSSAAQIRWIQESSGLAAQFVRRALENEEFLLACDAGRETLRHWQRNGRGDETEILRVGLQLTSALTRLGYTREARRELNNCRRSEPGTLLKAAIYRQLAAVEREEAQRASDRATSLRAVEEALSFNEQARLLEPHSLEALTWAAAEQLYVSGKDKGRRSQALATADELLLRVAGCEAAEGRSFATARARAEGLAILGREDEARSAYAELGEAPDCTISALAEARYRTRFIADALDKPRDFFRGAFPPLQLVVFTGHMPDRPGVPVRFPPSSIDRVRELIREKLSELNAHIGISSAAAGADLLFLDELGARKASCHHVVLPWSESGFRATSLRPFEPVPDRPMWEPMFDKAMEAAASVRQLGELYEPGGSVGWEYMAEVTAGLALHTARMLHLDIRPLALWDRQPGRGVGGTEDFVRFWDSLLGVPATIIDMPRGESPSGPGQAPDVPARVERPLLHQEVKTMLFADIVGYSRLPEHVIPEFVTYFLNRLAELAATSRHAPHSINTWGDAIYAVFDFAVDAGNFALELTRMIRDETQKWLQHGLYWEEPAGANGGATKRPLNLRVGLHTGPVFLFQDRVVQRMSYTGAHVSRAARIEPVAEPGEVYTSEEFAAFAELDAAIRRQRGEQPAAAFTCEYVGNLELAKGYPGRHRLYRLVSARRLDNEELAIAIHDKYCEEARKRGETEETNALLRPWSELSENMRDANREQAADIPYKLRRLGYDLRHHGGMDPQRMALPPDRVEELAKREHVRWMTERQRNGWTFGPTRDNERKQHPSLVEWEMLSEVDRDKDRDAVRNLPYLVQRARFQVRMIGED
jgi:class 3 adenylate cyclase